MELNTTRYTVTDGSLSAAGTATLDITPVNDAPLGGDDTVLVINGFPLQLDAVGLLANDVDPDGDALQIVAVSPPGFGTLVDNGNGTWTYAPQAGFTGVDTFSYQVADPSGATESHLQLILRLRNVGRNHDGIIEWRCRHVSRPIPNDRVVFLRRGTRILGQCSRCEKEIALRGGVDGRNRLILRPHGANLLWQGERWRLECGIGIARRSVCRAG